MKTHTVAGGGGLKLHVEETGSPDSKPILFIHGFSQCRLSWNRQLHSDLANDFRLIAMDIRGHGLSEKPRDVYGDSQLWADDVQAVITTLGLDQPVLSGWSYGGVIMADYIKVYGEEQVAGTNWVGAVSRLGDPLVEGHFLGDDFLALGPGFFSENIEESVTALQQALRLCVHAVPSPEDAYFFLGYNVIVPPYVRQGLLSRHLNHDPVIATMRKPMLPSYGEQDAIVLLSMGKHLAGLAPHAKMSVYPDVGHAPFWEAPERFNRELREFRASV
jgi:pimeloyl-ACP methyl ester carboxylesterase